MSSTRLPRQPPIWVTGNPIRRSPLRAIRNPIGWRVDITPSGVGDAYNLSPDICRPERDGLILSTPIEFDLIYTRIFYNTGAPRVGSLSSEELKTKFEDAGNNIVPNTIPVRKLIFDQWPDDEKEEIKPKEPPKITKTEEQEELIYKYRYLNDLEVEIGFGVTIFWAGRLVIFDKFCLWDKYPGDQSEEHKKLYASQNESDILLNMGYVINCYDHQRQARHIHSQERVFVKFRPIRYPKISIGLEVVLDGLMYTQI